MKGKSYPNVIGDRVRQIRMSARLSEEQMAKWLRIKLAEYRDFESGKYIPKKLPHLYVMRLYM
ncbi:MAG: hypothetical protein FWG39_00625 [Alphaproteobacteria bacterium]|nr:hypothetical protein [Alphaproteobacteria bacterium]